MELFEKEVNDDGGIYLEEYGKKLPIEFLVYDDKSDAGTMTRLTEKLILEDKVDFLWPACGTSYIFAQAPIANKYGYVLLTAEGGATQIKDALPGLPYVFVTLSFSDWYQLPVFADLLAEKGAKTAYVTYIADLHGIEYSGVAGAEFTRVGIEIIGQKSIPPDLQDYSPIIKDAKAANPDVFCCFAYPWMILPATEQSIALGFNPKAWIGGPGANFGFYPLTFGNEAVDGVCCFAVANRATSAEEKELFDKLEALVGPPNLDWWGQPLYWAMAQFWKQAVEMAGSTDQDVLREIVATQHFDTILGDTWYDTESFGGSGGGIMAKESHPGEIGQWQNGICEIIGAGPWPNSVTTADFVYPKPPFPTP
jgi:branched-chain amino acid transport system substrate-binding protein